MNREIAKTEPALKFLFLALVVLPFECLATGWAMVVMWGWFVVPFFKLPPLSTLTAIGLGLFVSITIGWYTLKTNPVTSKDFVAPFVRPLLLLLVGWGVHSIV